MSSVLLLSAALTSGPSAEAQDRIIGLLTLPEVFGRGPCEQFVPEPVTLFAGPGSNEIVGTVTVDRNWTFPGDGGCAGLTVNVHAGTNGATSELPTREFEYEAPAAIVLDERDGWYMIQLSDGAAWVHPSERDEFLSLQKLFTNSMTYLTDAWDQTLAPAPGAEIAARFSLPNDPRRRIVGVLELIDDERVHWIEAFEEPDRAEHVPARFQTSSLGTAVETALTSDEVLVFDTRRGWFQVALRRDDWRDSPRMWIQDAPFWRFHTVAEQERQKLAERVWGREHSIVNVVGGPRETADGLWFEVEVMSHSICEGGGEPTVVGRGWVPAHSPTGEPTVWFYSRGC